MMTLNDLGFSAGAFGWEKIRGLYNIRPEGEERWFAPETEVESNWPVGWPNVYVTVSKPKFYFITGRRPDTDAA